MAWLVEERTVFSAILVSKKLSSASCGLSISLPSTSPLRNPTASSFLLSHAPRIAYDDTCTRSLHAHRRTRGHSSFRLYLIPLFFSSSSSAPALFL